jgi:hypothetical protein
MRLDAGTVQCGISIKCGAEILSKSHEPFSLSIKQYEWLPLSTAF